MYTKSLQSCPTLCDSMDCSPPGSSLHGILQTRILEWVAMPSSTGSSWPRDQTHVTYVSCIGRRILYHCSTWEGIWNNCWWDFPARILEPVAISFSRGYFQPRDQTCISCLAGGFFITAPPGKPKLLYTEWINNKVLLYSTENYIQYSISHSGKQYFKK